MAPGSHNPRSGDGALPLILLSIVLFTGFVSGVPW